MERETTTVYENDIDAVLIEFEREGGDLKEWVANYPEYAAQLRRYVAFKRVAEIVPVEEDAALTEHLFQIGLKAVEARRQQGVVCFESLEAEIQSAGFSLQKFAESLRLGVSDVRNLHRRLVVPTSVPQKLVTAIAEKIRRTSEEVASYLTLPPVQPTMRVAFRADSAPKAASEQIDFAEMLKDKPDAKNYWLSE